MGEEKTCCCGCFPVRTGTIIIAIIWLIACSYNIYAYCSQMTALTADDYKPAKLVESYSNEQLREILMEMYTNHRTLMTIYTGLNLIAELINAPLTGVLLHVAIKRGPGRRLLPWIGYNVFTGVIAVLFSFLVTFYLTMKLGGVYGFVLALIFLGLYAFYFYLIRVVYFYCQELQREENGGQVGFDGVTVGFVSQAAPATTQDKSYYM